MKTVEETIETAALMVEGEVWTLPRPARHCHLVNAWVASHQPVCSRIPKHAQGFVTSTGRFVDRDVAADLAFLSGQLETRKKYLYSEDLW